MAAAHGAPVSREMSVDSRPYGSRLLVGALAFAACGRTRDSAELGPRAIPLPPTATEAESSTPRRPLAPPFRPASGARSPRKQWDWSGIVGSGQSLAVGAQSGRIISTTQPFHNLKLSLSPAIATVPPYDANDPALSVKPLVEPIRPIVSAYPGAYPFNIFGETPHTAMGSQISSLYAKDVKGGDYVTVHTVVGESGQALRVIDKTATPTANLGHAYAATLFEAAALKRLAARAGKTYGVGAILLTHGETDSQDPTYAEGVARLLADYNADLRAITGQREGIPVLLTQQQTGPTDGATPESLIAEWRLGVDHPGEIVCVGPKYQYAYASDRLHLTALGYDQLGEKYGEVYYETVVLGRDWQPLQPTSLQRRGKVITVDFHVPVSPLAWDESLPAPHRTSHLAWSKGRGFEVDGAGKDLAIDAVAIQDSAVIITLALEPSTPGIVVRYAVTQDGDRVQGGLGTGRIGQLRDSDPLVGYATGLRQYNYAVSFVAPVD